jgi:hypothetical protein
LLLYRSVYTFQRTVSNKQTWDDEPKRPFTGNLTNHIRDSHRKVLTSESTNQTQEFDDGFGPASSALMEEFAKEGFLNPAREATQEGFYRLFAAWLLDDDHPWTTGETPSIRRLFHYLKIKFLLPSDTTVRRYVAKIFIELHSKVVKELTVCIALCSHLRVAETKYFCRS